jgi:hypothetical protein
VPDIDGDAVLAARRRLLAVLEQPGTLGFAFHLGDQAFGRLKRTQTGALGWETLARHRAQSSASSPLTVSARSFGVARG